MKNCVIYARFSSYGQNEQSIEAQIRICKEFAENKGLKVIKSYSDKARSGTNDKRPAFQRMISDAQSGAFQYIIVYMFDRFARNRRDSIIYKEMLREKYGIKVLSALEPIAEDEGGEFYEMFLEWNAEKYSKRLSKRIRDGLETNVVNGLFCGGNLIYGYRAETESDARKPGKNVKRIVIQEEEAEAILRIFQEYDKGISKMEIAQNLNEQGYRLRGNPFKAKDFDKWLCNEKYTGEFVFGGRPCNNMYPAIIDKELFQRVQKRLSQNKYFAGGSATAKTIYLLTGKLFCGYCGEGMVAGGGTSRTGVKHYYYVCKKNKKGQCPKKWEHKDDLELYVTSCVIDFLSDRKNAEVAVDEVLKYYEARTDERNIKAIQSKISHIHAKVKKLTDAFVNAKSSLLRNNIETEINEYETQLEKLTLQQAQLELERGYQVTREDLLEFITELLKGDRKDKEYQRQIIDHLVHRVYVKDDYTIIYFNINGGENIEIARLDDANNAILNMAEVQMQSPLLHQAKPGRPERARPGNCLPSGPTFPGHRGGAARTQVSHRGAEIVTRSAAPPAAIADPSPAAPHNSALVHQAKPGRPERARPGNCLPSGPTFPGHRGGAARTQVSHRRAEIVTRSAAPPAAIADPSPAAPYNSALVHHERLRLNHGSVQPFFICVRGIPGIIVPTYRPEKPAHYLTQKRNKNGRFSC